MKKFTCILYFLKLLVFIIFSKQYIKITIVILTFAFDLYRLKVMQIATPPNVTLGVCRLTPPVQPSRTCAHRPCPMAEVRQTRRHNFQTLLIQARSVVAAGGVALCFPYLATLFYNVQILPFPIL